MEEEKSLREEMRELKELMEQGSTQKKKQIKIPRKAKVSKGKMKKGWVGVLFVNENNVISGEKTMFDGGTYRTKDGNIHVTNSKEIFFWEGKYPVLFQRYDKLNPTDINSPKPDGQKNEIYGQDMVELRMKRDLIKEKKVGGGKGSILMWILVIGGGYFLLKMFFPKLFGA